MKLSQVAAQLYTLRDHLKTPEDMKKTLKRVHEIGFQAVQLSGLGPIAEEEIAAICKDNDLVICATHEPGKDICEDTQKVIKRLQKLNCKYTAYPYPHVPLDSYENVKKLAAMLDEAGKKMRDAGQVLTYHNHAIEFMRHDGKIGLDIIYDSTNPEYLQAEIDTFWIQTGGQNPARWCAKMKNRLPLLHMKGYKVKEGNGGTMGEIGNDNLNWPEIIAAAEQASSPEWFIIEQDASWINDDPFAALKLSFEYTRDHLVGEYKW
ncbi:MAG: sugar phosphate isomerase/epimerase [Planctomycetes bacterium]|nr:sugar phosphate isomerase/epimerase [Planctomycetota bacterium]